MASRADAADRLAVLHGHEDAAALGDDLALRVVQHLAVLGLDARNTCEIQASFSALKAAACSGSNSTISMDGLRNGLEAKLSLARTNGQPDLLKPAHHHLRGDVGPRARALGAVNLGQGFPDDPGPEAIRAKAADAVLNGYNQYPPMAGLPELRQAVAAHYARTQGLDLDWASEVTVTSGATEALAARLPRR